MNLDPIEVHAAFHALGAFIRDRRRLGVGVPAPVQRLYERAARAHLQGADPADTPDPRIADDEIGTAEAAAILAYSERYVRMIAADLDGIRVGRTWVFNRRTVTEYARARSAV